MVTHENSNLEITGQILQCLRPGAWLNDEVGVLIKFNFFINDSESVIMVSVVDLLCYVGFIELVS